MKRVMGLFILMAALSTKAQVKVSGKVSDTKGKPVGGVSITLKNTYDGYTTDSSGNYSFTTTEKGPQKIEATITGYKPYEQDINLGSAPVILNISLKELV